MSAPWGLEPQKKVDSPPWEVADIFRLYGENYRDKHPLPLSYLKVMSAIKRCRTVALGGHLEECESCGHQRPAYNSWLGAPVESPLARRPRPNCQCLAKAKWLEDRRAELLPVTYFHNVFTLPHELNGLILRNKKVLLNLLFKASAETLKAFGQRHLGGQLGFLAILHTWKWSATPAELLDHFHLHLVIPGGALCFESGQWIGVKGDYLFNVEALSGKFRGKYLDGLKKAYQQGALQFPGKIADLGHPIAFQSLIDTLYGKPWVVFSKESFDHPDYVLDYLARYTHRVAIANHRILSIEEGQVVFSYQNRETDTRETTCISAEEFIRRFLLHVLPQGFMRIRFYGFLAHHHKAEKLNIIRKALGMEDDYQKPSKKSSLELISAFLGEEWNRCPVCEKGTMRRSRQIPVFHSFREPKVREPRPERNNSS